MMRARVLRVLHLTGLYLFWPAVALVVWGELAPGAGIPGVWDKLQHFVAYGGLAGMAVLAVGERKHAVRIAAAMIVMGAALEFIQAFAGRDASVRDEIANALGALAGAFTAAWLLDFLRMAGLQSAAKPGETEKG